MANTACTAVTTLCPAGVQTSTCTWTAAGSGIVDPTCTTAGGAFTGEHWIEYTPTAGATSFNPTFSDNLGGGTNPLNDVAFQLYSTTGNCSSTFTYIGCYNNNGGGGTTDEDETFAVTAGVTYYIRVYDADRQMDCAGGGRNQDFVYCINEAGTPPPNDLCANAIDLPCGTYEIDGTTAWTTSVAHGTGCVMSTYGVWYKFTGDGNDNLIWVSPDANYDTEIAITTGTCGSLTNVACADNPGNGVTDGILVSTTLGTTYYVYVAYWLSSGSASETGSIKISRSCSDNNTCASANPLPCDTTIIGSNYGAASVAHGTGCTMANIGSWYSFVGDGQVTTILAQAFTTVDFEMAITSGTCGSLTNIACIDNGVATESYTFTATSGVTYNIYIADYFSAATTEFNFTIIRTCGNSCGNDANNDYCSDPAQLFQGGGGWSSSTTDTYTPDLPANTEALFCGSIENNSWYQFTAASTTETFNFTNVVNCALGAGVQAEVYSVTKDGSGCCTNLTSVSNCMSNGTTADATVTATGLTIGNQYILMVDGFAGDQCDFTVTGWTANGILPVKLLEYTGRIMGDKTKLKWITETEVNNDYFLIQKSSNGKNFIDLGTVDGNGNSNSQNHYEFYDASSSPKISYYRLKQFDFDGKYEYSKMIAVVSDNEDIDLTVYPNPSKENLFVDFSNVTNQEISVSYIDVLGKVISENLSIEKNKNTYQLELFNRLDKGFYIVQFYDETSSLIKSQRIIKQ